MTTATVAAPAVSARRGHATARADLFAGARAMGPWLVGVVPFGVVVGVTLAGSSVDVAVGLTAAVTIYSGSAQLAAIEVLDSGTAPLVAVATVLAINARLVFYSASMAPHWQGTSRSFRALSSYLLVDPSCAVGVAGYRDRRPHAHYLGGALTLWLAWQAAIVVGLVAGAVIPDALHLEHAVALFLVAEVAQGARSRPGRAAAATGALAAIATSGLHASLGPLAGIVAGLGAAWVVERGQP